DNARAIGNPFRTGFLLNKAIEKVSRERNLPLFQCNWTGASGLFTSYQSVVNRCTGDYFSPDPKKDKPHHKTKAFTHAGYQAALLTGSLVWPDHDEYDPTIELTRRIDTVRRAVSGGGMVAYKIPKKLHPEIAALFYEDGEIIRPLAPGVLTEDCLFSNSQTIGILKARAPLPNRTAVFHVVNIDGPQSDHGKRLDTVVTVDNYRNASGLMQPYPGQWPVPEEGLYVYDSFSGTGQLMPEEGYTVYIEGFRDALLQVSPIVNGWSVIGRTDKYLSAAVVEILENTTKTLRIKLNEGGAFAVYSSHKAPVCEEVTFVDKGNGLYQAKMPAGKQNVVLTLTR
ncbi:MAG TPA: Sip1-related alpha-galactosidase, partial [candidate division Zixibacteria bacterium]|nr:Sip1-related alpha-galactosidase [candidate division Zixibacteria bacterium]